MRYQFMDLSSSRVEQLIHCPERHKVVETLGWQPGIWGAFFIAAACLLILPVRKPMINLEWLLAGASALTGVVFAVYEIRRRKNRTVLVRDGEHVKVFRNGRLDLALPQEKIAVVNADLVTMIKIGFPLGLCSVMFTAIGMTGILKDRALTADSLTILLLGFAFGASFASAAWTRLTCSHLRVPVKGSRWLAEETVLVPKSRMGELFPFRMQ